MDLKTKRLSIRPFSMEDTDALFSILSDPEVMRFIEPPYTWAQTAAFISDQIRADVPQAYALTENATGELVGHVIWQPHDSEAHELGWVLGKSHWGKGYAAEVTDALLASAKAELRDVVIQCILEQTQARRIAEERGFFYLGIENGLCVYRYVSKTREGCLTDAQREVFYQVMHIIAGNLHAICKHGLEEKTI